MKAKNDRQKVVRDEIDGLELGDARRARRALSIVERLAATPEASLPDAMGDRAAIEALYRHLSQPEVTLQAVLAPHIAKTVERVARARTIYAIADTTEFIFPGAAERAGLGPINGNDQGFLAHVTLAVAADGTRTPLGVIGLETWARSGLKGRRNSTARKHDGARESLRWSRNMTAVAERIGNGATVIHLADREGDIYDLLATLISSKHRFIIRAGQDRLTEPMDGEDAERLFDAAQSTPTAFTLDVPMPARTHKRDTPPANRRAHPARSERTARLSFAARSVTLRRPRTSRVAAATLEVNIVHVFELGPPLGEPPIEWVLLTTEPIDAQPDVERVVAGYRTRWVIEEYFKTIKTGCAFEARQLESLETLEALLGYTVVVAYALLLMRSLSRDDRDIPATELLTPTQLMVLRAKVKKLGHNPTVRDALLAIAGMGGHLKNNGEPGWRTLSRGWRKLLDLDEGYALAEAAKK